jgi:hypothetical protein
MTPIDFRITNSNVIETEALDVKMVSADYLDKFLSQSLHISHIDWP